jgi:DinB superfamily
MKPHARQFALDQLAASEAKLLALFDGLSDSRWHFRESPERWSIAENLEHLIAFEAFIRTAIQRTLEAPSEPEKKSTAASKEPLVLGLATSRSTKFTAREIVRPIGRWTTPAAIIEEFRKTRAQTIAFAAQTQAPLRDHFFPHIAFGDLDCYQWLLVLGQHTGRHAAQIEQIKADPAYPTA